MTIKAPGRTALEARSITKRYTHRGVERAVIDGVDLSVCKGEVVAVVGRSGTGKSTLLNILGVLDRPDSGTLEVGGTRCERLGASAAARVRATSIGFVFQAMNLIPHLSVAANIAAGTWPATRKSDRERTESLLSDMGITDLIDRRAAELSLGEQQRVAVVRALVKKPAVVLADEPTGSLDAENESAVMTVLRRVAHAGSGVVIVTHSDVVASLADRTVHLGDGVLLS